MPSKESSVDLPVRVHFLGAMAVCVAPGVHGSRVFAYGDELEITQEIVDLNTDRTGHCALLDRLDSESGTVRRGPWPEGVLRLLPGSFEHAEARETARQEAHRILDPVKRQAALKAVGERYGSVPTSRTLCTYS